MKLLLLLSIFASATLQAQDTINNFKLVGTSVIWQKTYPTALSAFDVYSSIKARDFLTEAGMEDSGLAGDIEPFDLDIKGAGFSEWTAPIYLSRNTFDGFATIEATPGKYTVTVRHMIMTQKFDEPMSKQGEKLYLEKIALDLQNKFSLGFIKSPSAILNYTLNKMFDLEPPKKKEE